MKLKILALWPLQRTLTDPALGSAGLRRIVGRFLGTSWKRCPRLSPTVHWSHDPIALQGGWAMPSSWSSGERKQACGHTALSRHTFPPWLCTPSPRRPLHGGPLHGGPLQVGKLREGWHCPCPVSVACPRLRTGGPRIVTEGENESVSPAGTADPARTLPCPARSAFVSPRSSDSSLHVASCFSGISRVATPRWTPGTSLCPQGACRPAGDTGSEQRITNCANKSEMTTAN